MKIHENWMASNIKRGSSQQYYYYLLSYHPAVLLLFTELSSRPQQVDEKIEIAKNLQFIVHGDK